MPTNTHLPLQPSQFLTQEMGGGPSTGGNPFHSNFKARINGGDGSSASRRRLHAAADPRGGIQDAAATVAGQSLSLSQADGQMLAAKATQHLVIGMPTYVLAGVVLAAAVTMAGAAIALLVGEQRSLPL